MPQADRTGLESRTTLLRAAPARRCGPSQLAAPPLPLGRLAPRGRCCWVREANPARLSARPAGPPNAAVNPARRSRGSGLGTQVAYCDKQL